MATWEQWKRSLNDAVKVGEEMGMSQGQMTEKAAQIGDYLSRNVDPNMPEQRVLQELWQAGDEAEQEALASMLVKISDSTS